MSAYYCNITVTKQTCSAGYKDPWLQSLFGDTKYMFSGKDQVVK